MIIIKMIDLLALLYCIKYIYDRFNNKKENIGLDNATIIFWNSLDYISYIFIENRESRE